MRDRLIRLSRSTGMTRALLRKLLHFNQDLQIYEQMTFDEFADVFKLPKTRATSILVDFQSEHLSKQLEREQTHLEMITIYDELYPYLLRHIDDCPLVLYLVGNKELLKRNDCFSIIGSRRPSKQAWQKTKQIVAPLAEAGFVIVSGMAEGIDTYSHLITLEQVGSTIAVLGSGFNHIYPRTNKKLFHRLMNEGLIISEYPPHVTPRRHHFPERNRIISGLSFGTVVIEAKKRSGTMITVREALSQGREVYAVPGSMFDQQAEGCHELINDGAKLITSPVELMKDWFEIGLTQYAK